MKTQEIEDEWVADEDLLIEAARYAVHMKVPRNRFMSLAKKMWFQAAIEAGHNPQTSMPWKQRRGDRINGRESQEKGDETRREDHGRRP